MQYFQAQQYPLPIRADLPDAYRAAWDIIAAPGNWWNAEERIAIAQETRDANNCNICKQRNLALSPNGPEHQHAATNVLSGSAIDAIHRITNDASRLSKSWLESIAADGVSDGHYIEILGIVVGIISIDTFHKALSIAPEQLPQPKPGEPTGYRPPGAKPQGAWVDTVAPADVTEAEADLYGGASQTGNVLAAMSLVPSSVGLLTVISEAQYLKATEVPNPSTNGGRAINRMQMELLAGRVSSINECFY